MLLNTEYARMEAVNITSLQIIMSGPENNEKLVAPENNEKLGEKSKTLQYFEEGIQNISKGYSKYQEPKSQEVRNLSIKQLQALKTKITSYREDVISW